MNLAVRATDDEQMDAADLAGDVYARILADLAQVNRLTMAAPPTLGFLRRAIGARKRVRILDVGFGHGDMLRAVHDWCATRGIAADLVGIDLNPRSAPIARAATPWGVTIDYRTGNLFDLTGEHFDVIISGLVAHHMPDTELVAFLRFMEAEADLGWMVNDLRRSRIAYAGYPWLARAMRWHRIVREDGRLSIARSFRREDWRGLLSAAGIKAGAARIVPRFPFRLCVERLR